MCSLVLNLSKFVPVNYILWLHFFHLLKSILRAMDPEMNKCYKVTQSALKVWTQHTKPKRPLQASIKMSEISDTDILILKFLRIQSSEKAPTVILLNWEAFRDVSKSY